MRYVRRATTLAATDLANSQFASFERVCVRRNPKAAKERSSARHPAMNMSRYDPDLFINKFDFNIRDAAIDEDALAMIRERVMFFLRVSSAEYLADWDRVQVSMLLETAHVHSQLGDTEESWRNCTMALLLCDGKRFPLDAAMSLIFRAMLAESRVGDRSFKEMGTGVMQLKRKTGAFIEAVWLQMQARYYMTKGRRL